MRMTECCVYNELIDLFLNRLEVKKNSVFKISDTAEIDKNFIDDYVLNIEVDKDWKNYEIFTNWKMFSWKIICSCSAEDC